MSKEFPVENIIKALEKEEDFVFLDSARSDPENARSYLFWRPESVISTSDIDQVSRCFGMAQEQLRRGNYVAGFVSYEAGRAFEEKLADKKSYDFPLLWLGVYKKPLVYDHSRKKFERCPVSFYPLMKKIRGAEKIKRLSCALGDIRANVTLASYRGAIRRIKQLIARGLTYQVNYTFKLKFSFTGSLGALYLRLRKNQPVPYAGLLRCGRYAVASFSPELFFKKQGHTLLARPMKGTSCRGRDARGDSQRMRELANCAKNRSENVMIVDLLRNDLGRISLAGSVSVPRLFNVEKYDTLLQMTSDIQGRLRSRFCDFDIFRHIFPSGSVTGAPKLKTMQIIAELEKEPRNVYTGSIGFFSPKGEGLFNVAIRTVVIDEKQKRAEMGVGSGIIYDSDPSKEYEECRLKARFLTQKETDFMLLETMLWKPKGGYYLLPLHLKRLQESARYFNFIYDKEAINGRLRQLEKGFTQRCYRVRLLLAKDGRLSASASFRAAPETKGHKVCFAARATASGDTFLYHKTTRRALYDAAYQRCRDLGLYDMIFTNEKGEVTEGAISNVIIRKGGRFYTPPSASGLLNGVYRQHLLRAKRPEIKEKVLYKKDILAAEAVYLCNSLRGLVKVTLEAKNH